MVGGDFYDVWEVRDSWMVVIGDVTGKGIEAAALTALVRHTLRTASEFHTSPAQLLSFVDATLKKRPALSVCTALCLRLELERDSAKFAVGGHPLPLHVTARGIQEPGEHGPLLGAFPDAQWQDFTLQLQAGDTVVAYTDGITDAQGEGDGRFGLRRLCDTLEQLGGRQVAELVYGLARKLEEFQTGTHTDDTAAIALRRLPDGAKSERRQETDAILRTGTITTPA